MARQLTTRAQVNGYRFLLSRLEHALVRRDVRMLHDPMRSQSRALILGTVLALLVVAGCGIWGLVRPQGSVGESTIVMSKDNGGLYVVIKQGENARPTLHPVLNLASARLIMNSAASPASVSEAKLAAYPRGPLLGIPGAPASLSGSASVGASEWAVCAHISGVGESATQRLSVINGPLELGAEISTMPLSGALLVSDGRGTHLIHHVGTNDGVRPVRSQVDTDDPAVMRAFGLVGQPVRPIGTALLNTIPETAGLVSPVITGAGTRTKLPGVNVRVGSVIKTVGINDEITYYVVLRNGIQQVGAATAELLRLGDRSGDPAVITLPPAAVVELPHLAELPVADHPATAPRVLGVAVAPTTCTAFVRESGQTQTRSTVLVGRSLPLAGDDRPVELPSADGSGPGIDSVYVRPGSGEYLQVTGNEADSPRSESLFYLNDSGVRFGIPDPAIAAVLGLSGTPKPVPWSVVSLLTAGPTLSRTNALVAHDGMGADLGGVTVSGPQG